MIMRGKTIAERFESQKTGKNQKRKTGKTLKEMTSAERKKAEYIIKRVNDAQSGAAIRSAETR